MKKLFLMMGVIPLIVLADKETVNGIEWTYSVSGGIATVGTGAGSWRPVPAIPKGTVGAITIPSTLGSCPVTKIEGGAFYGCSELTAVAIPSTVTSIGHGAFAGTKLLEEHADGMEIIDGCLIGYKGTCVGSVVIPEGVRLIAEYAFQDGNNMALYWPGAQELTSVTIPASVTVVGDRTFNGCPGLKSIIVLDDNATYSSKDGVLYDKERSRLICCPAGKTGTLELPESVMCIERLALDDCLGLTSITVEDGNSVYKSLDGILYDGTGTELIKCPVGKSGVVRIPSGVMSIGSSAFSGCSALTSVTIPPGVTSIGERAFYGCKGLTSVEIPTTATIVGVSAFQGCSKLISVTIPSGVTSIADRMFEDCGGLISVTMSEGVTSIGESAFENCSCLSAVTIPSSVTNIAINTGGHAFANCRSIQVVFVPDEPQECVIQCFGRQKWYQRIGEPIAYEWKYSCKGSETVITGVYPAVGDIVIPSTLENCPVTSVGERAFYGCSGLTSVVIPPGVLCIGNYAFDGCGALTNVTVEGKVTEVGRRAFAECVSMSCLYFKEVVAEVIGGEAFWNCNRQAIVIENLYIPGDRWAGSEYRGMTGIKNVIIGEGADEVEYSCFEGCSGITNVVFPSSIRRIDSWAFKGCTGLTEIVLPENMISLEYEVFGDCTNLFSVTILSDRAGLHFVPFANCVNLTQLNIRVSSSTYLGINEMTGGTPVHLTVNILDPCREFLCSMGSNDYVKELNLPEGCARIGEYAVAGCWALESVYFPTTLQEIDDFAFENCSQLKKVELPEGLASIGEYAFYDCLQLETPIRIPNSVTNIGELAFYPHDISDLIFDSGNENYGIEDGVLYKLERGAKVEVIMASKSLQGEYVAPRTVKKIYSHAFDGCKGITSIVLPDGLVEIGGFAFSGCIGLVSLNIPWSVCNMGDASMRDVPFESICIDSANPVYCKEGRFICRKVDDTHVEVVGADRNYEGSLVLPDDVVGIGEYGFADCGKLINVHVGSWVSEIAGCAFYECERLRSVKIDSTVELGADAFCSCGGLEFASIRSSVIGFAAFYGCGRLSEIVIASTVEEIDFWAFEGCNGLHTVYVDKGDVERVKSLYAWSEDVQFVEINLPLVNDDGALVIGDPVSGFIIKPSEGRSVVEVTIPQDVDAAKVTVEVSPKVASVKPNGAKVKVVNGSVDITEFLNVPVADGDGVIDLTKATVKEEIVKEAMDVEKGAKIVLDAANPSLTTPNTRVGLFYQLREGVTIDGMANGDSTIGDGKPWSPEIKVKGGNSAFYSIGVGKGE